MVCAGIVEDAMPYEQEAGDEERQRRARHHEERLGVEPGHMSEARAQEDEVTGLHFGGLERMIDSDRLGPSRLRRRCDAVGSQIAQQPRSGHRIQHDGRGRDDRRRQQGASRPLADDEKRHRPDGVAEKHVVAEESVRREAEEREDGEPAEIDAGKRPAVRFGPSELDGEPCAEEQRKGPVRLRFHQPPDERAHHVIEPARVGRLHVEMDDEHPEQRETAQDVQALDPLRRRVRYGQRRKRDGNRSRSDVVARWPLSGDTWRFS